MRHENLNMQNTDVQQAFLDAVKGFRETRTGVRVKGEIEGKKVYFDLPWEAMHLTFGHRLAMEQNIIQESKIYPGDGTTAPLSVIMRKPNQYEWSVHYWNHQTEDAYGGEYRTSIEEAQRAFERKVQRLEEGRKS